MKRTLIIENGEVFLNGMPIDPFFKEEVRNQINKIFDNDYVGWEK